MVQLYTLDVSGNRVISNNNVGTIDYTSGKLNLKLNVQSISNDSFIRVYASSNNNDVEVNRNQILRVYEPDTS